MTSPTYSTITEETPPSYLFYWIGLSLLTVGFIVSLVVWPPYFYALPRGYEAPTSLLFFGRFHPIVVHLPVGILALYLLIELGCMRASVEEKWGEMALLTSFATAVGCVVTVMFGIFLAREGGYKGGAYILHQALGIAATFGAIAACFLRAAWMVVGKRGLIDASRFILLATAGVLGMGAHFGGNMVHGSKYLIEYAPPALAAPITGMEKWLLSFVEPKKEAGKTDDAPPSKPADKPTVTKTPEAAPNTTPPAPYTAPAASGDKLVFQNVILPLLEAKCNKCHNADKSKGDLRMDTYELMMKGGENGKNIVPGKPEDSLSIQRILLPNDDDDHMPPDGKEQPTKEEIALLKWWIQEGASDKIKVADAKIPAELQATVDGMLKK